MCAGVYTIAVEDDFGCSVNKEIHISDESPNINENISSTSPSCSNLSDGDISVTVNGGDESFSY